MAGESPNGIVVGVADLAIARSAQDRITTFALGSCIGVTVWDPVLRVGGMLHYLLPQPNDDSSPADLNVAMYATTGIPTLFRRLAEIGVKKERVIVCAAGGAEVLNDSAVFAVGKRNRTILRKIFWKDGTVIASEDTGGNVPRTLSLELATGVVKVRTREGEKNLWVPGQKPAPQGAMR